MILVILSGNIYEQHVDKITINAQSSQSQTVKRYLVRTNDSNEPVLLVNQPHNQCRIFSEWLVWVCSFKISKIYSATKSHSYYI